MGNCMQKDPPRRERPRYDPSDDRAASSLRSSNRSAWSGSSSTGRSSRNTPRSLSSQLAHLDAQASSPRSNKNYKRRQDDTTVMAASLIETYRGFIDGTDCDAVDLEDRMLKRAIARSMDDVAVVKYDPRHDPNETNGREPSGAVGRGQGGKSDRRHSKGLATKLDATTPSKSFTADESSTHMSVLTETPFRVLGIDLNFADQVTEQEVQASYRQKARETHPDRPGGSDEAFAHVNDSYRRIVRELQRRNNRCQREKEEEERGGKGQRQRRDEHDERRCPRERVNERRPSPKQMGIAEMNEKNPSKRQLQEAARRRSKSSSRTSRRHRKQRSPPQGIDVVDANWKDHDTLVRGLYDQDPNNARGAAASSSLRESPPKIPKELRKARKNQMLALQELNLVPVEAGASNLNEDRRRIRNNCFYLSLAASYLSGVDAFRCDPTAPIEHAPIGGGEIANGKNLRSIQEAPSGASETSLRKTTNLSRSRSDTSVLATRAPPPSTTNLPRLYSYEKKVTMKMALALKRTIEASVVLAHPEWAERGFVGEEVQAFSDFLVYALYPGSSDATDDSNSTGILSHWSVVVFDESSGFVEVFQGKNYGKAYRPEDRSSSSRLRRCNDKTLRANTLTLRYTPGHYQPLLPEYWKAEEEHKQRDGTSSRGAKGQSTRMKTTIRPTLNEIIAALSKSNVMYIITDERG